MALAFARALGDFGTTVMVAGNIPGRTQTMPIAVYDAVQAFDDARAARLAAVLLGGAFAATGASLAVLAPAFVIVGIAIGIAETAAHGAVAAAAPPELRGSAFGLLAGIQSVGNLLASAVAGLLWTVVSPAVAFGYAALLSGAALLALARR